MTIPSISIKNAYLRYQQQIIFANLQFEIPAAKFTCICGPSGVGKSSLLRLIAGLLTTSEVSSQIQSSDNKPLSGRIAYMSQQDLLLPWCSILQNVLIGYSLRQQGSKQITEKAKTLLHQVGLNQVINQRPHTLSGGMRQRVALVRTLLEDKPIILMDEPFASVDAITRWQLQDLMLKLLTGKTVLFITHDPREALRCSDQIYVLAGRPAKLEHALTPPGDKPRDMKNPALLNYETELIARLIHAKEASGV